jgi:hypothetical protein
MSTTVALTAVRASHVPPGVGGKTANAMEDALE